MESAGNAGNAGNAPGGKEPGDEDESALTSPEAFRILERKGTMAHSTDRNQKMKSTPEDWTPCNRSYWIRTVASS